ncbi:MAG TPA: HdeD family acid-resistance protein [Albitalea sp.]|jgi:uncharacterized membrane protein HdeD (DUF308 family)|nr:HdeD family acid-resistance protein [Albitalea sp.]
MNATATQAANEGPAQSEMNHSARMLVLRGVIAIVFGVLAVIWPDLTLLWLVALFAVYALLSGGVSIAAAIRIRREERKWWLPLLLGIVSVAAGIAAIVYPALTALVLVLVMGANAIVTGALDIAIAIRLRKVLRGQWLLVLSGIVSVLFGALVFALPGAGALALVWLISLHAIVTGVLLLALGLRTRRAAHGGAAHRHAVPAR